MRRMNLKDLVAVRTVGTGTFGRVKLVRHEESGNTYALKCMQKKRVVDSHQQINVLTEKEVMIHSNHPFVLKLFKTFQDSDNIYLLIEMVQGGELWTLIYQDFKSIPRTALKGFDTPTCQFYAG